MSGTAFDEERNPSNLTKTPVSHCDAGFFVGVSYHSFVAKEGTLMLVLSRRASDEVRFPSLDIRVRILKAKGVVKLGIDAPQEVRVLRDEIEQAAADSLPTVEEIARLPRKCRHEIRNQLQSITVGLHLVQEQVKRGDFSQLERTMTLLLEGISRLGQHRAVRSPTMEKHHRPSAFLVDDEPNELELLSGLLRMHGFEVATADSGKRALSHLDVNKPDILLLDLNLPDMRGEQILQWVREQRRLEQLLVFVVSGSEYVPPVGSDVAPERVFQKPLSPQLLVNEMKLELCAC